MATKTKDPAIEAIESLNDSVSSSFEILEANDKKTGEQIAELQTEVRAGFEAHASRLGRLERGDVPGVVKRDTPTAASRLTDGEWSRERWLRGYLMSGARDNSYRDLGRSIMESAAPRRYQEWQELRHQVETAATIVSGSDTVQVVVFDEVVAARSDAQSVRAASRVVPLASESMKVPKVNAAFTAALVAENAAIGDGGGSYTSATLAATKFAAIGTISVELLEDCPFNVATDFFSRVRGAAGELENVQALEGTGGGGQFTGIRSAGGPTVALGATLTTLDKLFEMVTTIPESEIDPAECVWFMDKEGSRRLLQIKEGTTNAPMIQRNGILTNLLGYPVSLVKGIANNRGAGTNETTLYWGNFRRGLVIGDRGAEHFDTSLSATDTCWSNGLLGVRYYRRTAISVALPTLFVYGTGMLA